MVEGNLFAGNLRRLRDKYGLSQEALADKIGVSQSMIRHYEAGRNYPRVDKLEKLAEVFGVEPHELLTEERRDTLKYDEVVLLANYRKLNPEGRAVLAKQAAVMVASGMYNG